MLDDLSSSTLDGKPFDITEYAFDESKETKILIFAEYCYSFYTNLQGNYALYVYVWNPQGLKFVADSPLNMIQMKAGSQTNYRKYPLLYIDQSTQADYEGLFWKFKVQLTGAEKREFLIELNSSKREYTVSGIELLTQGESNATETLVKTIYTYNGYSAGYGSNASAAGTLTCSEEQADVLTLKPYPTTYRPEGTNGKNEYTQDSLHSVYFAVPNDFIKTFGDLSAVHATWLDAVLAPALVTGNQEAYNAIAQYLGQNIGTSKEELEYAYIGAIKPGVGGQTNWYGDYSYNHGRIRDSGGFEVSRPLGTLYLLFDAGSGTDSADHYTVPSELLKGRLTESKDKYGGELVNGKYSRAIFESVSDKFTEVNIERETEYALTSEKISQTWWEKLLGKTHSESTAVFDGIAAIQAINREKDLTGTAEEIASRLYISAGDSQEFVDYCNSTENADKTVFLFRYQVSDYVAQEAALYKHTNTVMGMEAWARIDTNAYFFQETVNLDFDIIDVTFSNGKKDMVVPVVMTPIDVVPDATPPVLTESDERDWWRTALGVILGVLLIVLIFKLLGKLFSRPKVKVTVKSDTKGKRKKK